jgi:hypothetical protein
VTITYVAAGAAAVGNNASVVPALPAGIAAGDLLLIAASIRNSGTGTVNTPAGWTQVLAFGNLALLGRWHAVGVTAPTVTFAGGVANADTIARCMAFRGVSPDALSQSVSATLLNPSAQNVPYPALDVPGAAFAVLKWLWKQDDATAYSTPGGWTTIAAADSTTTGDDASQALFEQVQTTEADIVGGTSTVTGGAAAISRAVLLALKAAAAITVSVQDVFPPRTQVTVTGLTLGDSVDVYRVVTGVRTLVRAGHTDAATDTVFIVVDAELPFGTPVSYVAVVEGTAEYATAATSYTLPGGKAVLSDAISAQAVEVTITADGGHSVTRDSARMRVGSAAGGGRNVTVTGPAGDDEGSYEFFTDTYTAHLQLLALLKTATEATVQLRQPGVSLLTGDPYVQFDAYLTVDTYTWRRYSQDGSDPRRLTTVQYAEAAGGWPAGLEARGFTLLDIATFFGPSGTLLDIANFFPSGTLLDIAEADWSP